MAAPDSMHRFANDRRTHAVGLDFRAQTGLPRLSWTLQETRQAAPRLENND
jgi:hypothetical protein